MFYCINSTTILGIRAHIVGVEVDVGRGLPVFDMGGYLASEVKEAKERVRVALRNSGYELKPQRITVNLSPADLRKGGTGFDLPIALGLLAANEQIATDKLEHCLVLGELSLDGTVHSVSGVLASVCAAKQKGFTHCIVPKKNFSEADCIEGMTVIGVDNLLEAVDYLNKGIVPSKDRTNKEKQCIHNTEQLDFLDIQGQETAKRATLIAAAGMHNILYIGPPGCGKTMMAKRIPGILPDLTFEEQLELTKIYSIAGQLDVNKPMISQRPFRSPHHSITQTALLGGGRYAVPGEITLAGKGVLFLDEMTEYKPSLLEALRQPLEDKKVTISRLQGKYSYPADFMLAGAMNPCRCGYYPDRNRCTCTCQEVQRYLGRISKPFWDRFDICIQLNSVNLKELSLNTSQENKKGMSTMQMRERVEQARHIQIKRFEKEPIHFNSEMNSAQIEKYCRMEAEAEEFIRKVYDKLQLTMRGYYKILKTARTIADIDGEAVINVGHISEAASYRSYEA